MTNIQHLETTLTNIGNLVRNGQSVAVVGGSDDIRGKLLANLCTLDWLQDDNNIPLLIDCQRLLSLSPHEVLALLADEIAPYVKGSTAPVVSALTRLQVEPSYLNFDGLIRQFDRRGCTLFFLLGEFSYLSQNPQLDLNFFNALRATANRYQLVFVTTSTHPLIDLTFLERTEDILTSPFFNIFATVNLDAVNLDTADLDTA